MTSVCSQIIEKIRRNRISTTEVAHCLNKSGVIEGVTALNRGHHRVGPIFWTYAFNESNWELHEQIRNPPAGSVILTHAFNCANRAIFGDLVAKYLLLYRQVNAVFACGLLRDGARLIKVN